MNHQLAKKLKYNAEFPQYPKIDISGIDGEFYGGFYYIVKTGVDEVAITFLNQREYEDILKTPPFNIEDLVKIPTLSELIEACGDIGFRLVKHFLEWEATKPHDNLRLLISGKGTTPEEAVANLLLELNKK